MMLQSNSQNSFRDFLCFSWLSLPYDTAFSFKIIMATKNTKKRLRNLWFKTSLDCERSPLWHFHSPLQSHDSLEPLVLGLDGTVFAGTGDTVFFA